MEILAAFLVLGFVTSAHCVGMCGPIVIALPLKDTSTGSRILSSVLYNLGRTLTYGILGLFFGLIGQGLELAGFQKIVSITMGSLMIISVIFPALFKKNFSTEKGLFGIVNKIKSGLGRRFSVKSYGSLFTIGILNGLLPCGPVYIAVFMAIATNNAIIGAIGMIIFGLGTIPALLTLSIISNTIGTRIKKMVTKIIPYIIILLGILFILRGLGLGIKYISPKDSLLKPHQKVEMMKDCTEKNDCCN
jgi:sulfite exporter TauE/SafE